MTRWHLRTSPLFAKAARRCRTVLRRIRAYLEDVCELDDPRQRGNALTVNLTGYCRYRIGDCRVVSATLGS